MSSSPKLTIAPTPFHRCHSLDTFEGRREVELIAVADLLSNVANGTISRSQELAGLVDTIGQNELRRCHLELLLEETGKVIAIEVADVCQLIHAGIVHIVVLDIVDSLSNIEGVNLVRTLLRTVLGEANQMIN